ncbi:MAG: hypothetical protein ACKOFI_09620, partial [Phycisphaerales bacterium]
PGFDMRSPTSSLRSTEEIACVCGPVEGADWDFGRSMGLDGGFLVPITPPVNRAPAPAPADGDDAAAGSSKNPSGAGSGRSGTGRSGGK